MISPGLIDSHWRDALVLPQRVVVQLNPKDHDVNTIVLATLGGQVIRRFLTPGLYEF